MAFFYRIFLFLRDPKPSGGWRTAFGVWLPTEQEQKTFWKKNWEVWAICSRSVWGFVALCLLLCSHWVSDTYGLNCCPAPYPWYWGLGSSERVPWAAAGSHDSPVKNLYHTGRLFQLLSQIPWTIHWPRFLVFGEVRQNQFIWI